MIKVEKGMCEIKAVNGVPDIMTDLACIIRSIRATMVEKRDYSEAETKELVTFKCCIICLSPDMSLLSSGRICGATGEQTSGHR